MQNLTLKQEINKTNRRLIKDQRRLQQTKNKITPTFLENKMSCLLLPVASFGLGWVLSKHIKIKTTVKPVWRVAKAGLLKFLLTKIS